MDSIKRILLFYCCGHEPPPVVDGVVAEYEHVEEESDEEEELQRKPDKEDKNDVRKFILRDIVISKENSDDANKFLTQLQKDGPQLGDHVGTFNLCLNTERNEIYWLIGEQATLLNEQDYVIQSYKCNRVIFMTNLLMAIMDHAHNYDTSLKRSFLRGNVKGYATLICSNVSQSINSQFSVYLSCNSCNSSSFSSGQWNR